MKVLVTGGAGFIGSYLIRHWLKTDPRIHIVNFDKLTYCGDLSRLKDVDSNPRYTFVKGDVANAAQVDKAIRGCEGVIHLAAETHVDRSLLDGETFFRTNTSGTYVLLEAAKKHGVRRFVYVSTDEVYGSRAKGFFKESDPVGPSSPYSVSKTAGDLLALAYAHTHGMNVSVTRGSNTFGPYQYPEKVIPLFVSNALEDKDLPLYGDGLQIRNWLYVEDHAGGILTVYKKGKSGEAYNISTKNDLTNIELTRRLLRVLGKPESLIRRVQDRLGHDRRYAIDSKKLRAIGWKERFEFKTTLTNTILWYKENRAWWEQIKKKEAGFRDYYRKAYGDRLNRKR